MATVGSMEIRLEADMSHVRLFGETLALIDEIVEARLADEAAQPGSGRATSAASLPFDREELARMRADMLGEAARYLNEVGAIDRALRDGADVEASPNITVNVTGPTSGGMGEEIAWAMRRHPAGKKK